MKGNIWFVSLLMVIMASCGPNYIFEETKPVAGEAWSYADSIQFQFNITDTASIYNQSLEVVHTTDYGFQNLYVKVNTIFPDGNRTSQVLSLELASKIGLWYGDCNEEQCSLQIPIQNNIFFPMPGTYTFVLEQYMRKDPLEGIQSFELQIEDTGKKKQ